MPWAADFRASAYVSLLLLHAVLGWSLRASGEYSYIIPCLAQSVEMENIPSVARASCSALEEEPNLGQVYAI